MTIKQDERLERFVRLIGEQINKHPFEIDGRLWAAKPQGWWAEQLGVSPATIRRVIGQPPFVRSCAKVGGVVCLLLRIGVPPAEKSDREVANILSGIWRNKSGRPTTRSEYGCIRGLVEDCWPKGLAEELLKTVLADWPRFMAGAKLKMAEGKTKFFAYPTLSVIRRFHGVALEMLAVEQQDEAAWSGKAHTPEQHNQLLALYALADNLSD